MNKAFSTRRLCSENRWQIVSQFSDLL